MKKTSLSEAAKIGIIGNGDADQALHLLFLKGLAEMVSGETQLIRALPQMAAAAQSTELKNAFLTHLEETQNHVDRLSQVLDSINETSKIRSCKAMQALIDEGSALMYEFKGSSALDTGLIAAAQKIEHHEIAGYGSLRSLAQQMSQEQAVELLEQTLEEEKATDLKLTEIAESLSPSKSR